MSAADIEKRFATAATSEPPTEQQVTDAKALRFATLDLAGEIDKKVPDGRWKSLALTALEEALMWANKGLFNEARPKGGDS